MSKTVVITGANRGIGLSLTKLYQSQKCKVYALCRESSAALEELDVEVVPNIDLASDNLAEGLQSRFSTVDIDLLINNAGILNNESLGSIDATTIRQQFEVNALGPLIVSEALLPRINNNGKIGFITSRMGSIADNSSGGRYGYRMSKVALNIAAVSMARDVESRGISVAILHPGLVGTEMIGGVGDITPDQAAQRLALRIDEMTLQTSGTFWHSNGEVLPW
ncbi:MAG: SDR family oxidoreductase [Pseudomonadales bacterium]|nr:SDR family oxidoreductase [Pseudomonadales bacterium]